MKVWGIKERLELRTKQFFQSGYPWGLLWKRDLNLSFIGFNFCHVSATNISLTKKPYSALHTIAIIVCSEYDNFSMFSLTLGHNAFKFDLFHINVYRRFQFLNWYNFFVAQSYTTHSSPNTSQSIPVPSSPVQSSAFQPNSVQ